MKVHRFVTSVQKEGIAISILDTSTIHQITRVLKLKSGEIIGLLDGLGHVWYGPLNDTKNGISIQSEFENEKELQSPLILYVAILKRDMFELVVQKATELGVTTIVPLITAHTVKLGLNYERLVRIATETTELSGRSVVPTIEEPLSFSSAIKSRSKEVVHVYTDTVSATDSIREIGVQGRAVWVGPEGGWSEEERKIFREQEIPTMSLGKTVLRGETAAIVAVYALRGPFTSV